jgi:hypothetical protein
VVFGYERKGFIRLKECFRVSKTEDHYQQFDFLCHLSSSFLPLLFDMFFIALLEHTHFVLVITFYCDLGMSLAFEFLGLLCLFSFLTAFSSFLIEIFTCPQYGV